MISQLIGKKMKTAILVSTIGSQTLSQAQWGPVKYCTLGAAFGSPDFSLDRLARTVLSQHMTARLSLPHEVNQSEISLSQCNPACSSLKLIRSKLDTKSLCLGKQLQTEADVVSNQTFIQVYNPQGIEVRSQVCLSLAGPQDSSSKWWQCFLFCQAVPSPSTLWISSGALQHSTTQGRHHPAGSYSEELAAETRMRFGVCLGSLPLSRITLKST